MQAAVLGCPLLRIGVHALESFVFMKSKNLLRYLTSKLSRSFEGALRGEGAASMWLCMDSQKPALQMTFHSVIVVISKYKSIG